MAQQGVENDNAIPGNSIAGKQSSDDALLTNSLVSVCVTAYNVEQYIGDCIASIQHQSYQNIEIVLVDDGSTDTTGIIMDQFAEQDPRIRVIHQQNGGFVAGRNACLDAATGDFLCYVDGDDKLMPDFVEYMLSIVQQTNAPMVMSAHCFTSTDHTQVEHDEITTWSAERAICEFFYPRVRLGCWNKLYNKQFLDKHQLRFVSGLTTGEGLQFITNAAAHTEQIGVGRRKVYEYRTDNQHSATSAASVEQQGIGALKTLAYIDKHLPLRTPTIDRAIQWHWWECYGYCLRQIMTANAQHEYRKLYKQCIHEMRVRALPVALHSDISLHNIRFVLAHIVSPVLITRYVIWRMRQQKAQPRSQSQVQAQVRQGARLEQAQPSTQSSTQQRKEV